MSKPFPLFRWLAVLAVMAAAAGGAWWIFHGRTARPLSYTTVTLAKGGITRTVTATGTLEPIQSVDVSSQISGIIQQVLVDYNSPVKEGDVIALIDPATYTANVSQAESDLANTQASLTLARLNASRMQTLRDGEIVSQSELDQAQAALRQAEAQVNTRTHQLEKARVDLARCTLTAPIDGIVISREAEVGKTVAASFNAPTLFVIANNLERMRIIALVSEADIGTVAEGQEATFTVDAFPSEPFSGTVSQIRNSPVKQENVINYETVVEVDNPELKLKPGMTANVSIVVDRRERCVRIPNLALRVKMPAGITVPQAAGTESRAGSGGGQAGAPGREAAAREGGHGEGGGQREGGGHREGGGGSHGSDTPARTVYRMAPGGTPVAVSVRTGITDGSFTEVLSGLSEGDVVVTGVATNGGDASQGGTNPFIGFPRRF